ncbi:MAG: hypothetical protein U1F51_20685 [Burkholderiales bacterium]
MAEGGAIDVGAGEYRLVEVLGRLTPAVRDEIVGMWTAEGVVAPAEAQRRVAEVVLVARAADGTVAGVNTAYVQKAPGTSANYWFYRMFLRPAHRGNWALPRAMFVHAIEVLRRHPHPAHPLGLVAIVENPRLMRKAAAATVAELGATRLGRDAQGRDVWCVNFDGTVPVAPPGLLRPA